MNSAPARGVFVPVYLNTGIPNVYVVVVEWVLSLSTPYVKYVLFLFPSAPITAASVRVAEYVTNSV